MKYQLFANLTNDEYDRLRADIAVNGVRDPIELDDAGNVLDGHHRKMIAEDLGIPCPSVVRVGWTEAQKREHIIAVHFGRRNLTPDQRREFIRQFKAEDPGASVREIASKLGIPKSTVADGLKAECPGSDSDQIDLATSADTPPAIRSPKDARSEQARALKAADPALTNQAIADMVGAAKTSVRNWLYANAEKEARKAPSEVAWKDLDGAMKTVELLSRADVAQIALAVPARRRSSTAKRLREEGLALGRIALQLEQMTEEK